MNETKIREQINQLIADQQKLQVTRKQYPVAKNQIAKLTELGILHLMPEKFGYTDAAVVIEAAISGKQTFATAYGEGEEAPASPLFVAINEATDELSEEEEYALYDRDETDDLIDGVSRIENERQLKQDAENS